MAYAPTPSSSLSTVLPNSQSQFPVIIYSLLSTSRLSFRNSHFPQCCHNYKLHFSSLHPYAALSLPQHQEYGGEDEEEESAIGDCLVYEEGIFDDPFPQNRRDFIHDGANARAQIGRQKIDATVEAENLIPEKWLDHQRELNMTKKERRTLSKEVDYGKRVEKKRRALMPINVEEYEDFKREKLMQLTPVVLDNPRLDYAEREKKDEKRRDKVDGEGTGGRVAPRNPRLAVYGGGLEDISALFSSGNYDPDAAKKPQGTRRLFSKGERTLLNSRIPDLAVSMSGKWHPLHSLVASGEFFLVNSLLKHGVDINAPDKNGLTGTHRAILGKKQAVFNFLLRESANPFVCDQDGATLMHYAVLAASSQMIKILLLYDVDINRQDNDGWTALHLAVQSRRTDIVRLLLMKGADQTLKNRDGLTALGLCLYSGRDTRTYELIKLLKRFGEKK